MLSVPRLRYADEFDPLTSDEVVDLVFPRRGMHAGRERIHRIPLVTVEFPKSKRMDVHSKKGVLGLTQDQVDWVLGWKCAMPWADIPSIEFLFSEAQHLWGHPLLDRFDTAIRDSMAQVAVEAVYQAFYLLSDLLYDPKTKYRPEHDDSLLWHRMATYYYWAVSEQVGSGLPGFFAKMDRMNRWTSARVRKTLNEIMERGRIVPKRKAR